MHAGTSDGDPRRRGDAGLCPACFRPRESARPCACGYDPSGPVPSRPLKIGTVLDKGRFTIGRVLGDGSFALVYLAREAGGTLVTIKEYLPRDLAGRAGDGFRVVPRTARTGSPGFAEGLKAFEAEGTLLSYIRHPNVVEVRHRFTENGTAYIVMPWHPGRTFAERIAKMGPLPSAEAAQVGLQVLAALRELHEGPQPCVHRDVKPENIYLCDDGTVLLLDFGAATKRGQRPAQPGFDHATPGYAPPEQWKTGKPESNAPAVDVYAWAAAIYTALTGTKPPAAGDSEAVRERDGDAPLAIPPSRDALSRLLWDCVRQGLSLTPAKRPTAAALHRRLRGLLERPSLGQQISAIVLMVVCFVLLAVLLEARTWAHLVAEAREAEQRRPAQQAEAAANAQPATVTRTAKVCSDLEIQYNVYTRHVRPEEKLVGVWYGHWIQDEKKKQGCGVIIIQPTQSNNQYNLYYYYIRSGRFLNILGIIGDFKIGSKLHFTEKTNYPTELGRTEPGGSTYQFDYQSDGSLSAVFTNPSGIQMRANFQLVPGSRR